MVELKAIDLEKNEVQYENFDRVNYDEFYQTFIAYWKQRIAGETISPFDMERFMKRGSSKNLKQLIEGKKAEGFMEASLGKKLDAGLIKLILIMAVIAVVIVIAFIAMQKLGIISM